MRSQLTGRRKTWRDRSRSHGSCRQSRGRRRFHDHSPPSNRSWSGKRSWRPGRSRRDQAEAVVASCNRGNSGSTMEPAPAVAGGSSTLPMAALPDLIRQFLSLSWPMDQRGAVLGSLLSPVLGVCLPPLHRCQQQPLLLARLLCPLQVRRLQLVQPLRPLCPVYVSVLRSPLLVLPVQPVCLPPLPLSLRIWR